MNRTKLRDLMNQRRGGAVGPGVGPVEAKTSAAAASTATQPVVVASGTEYGAYGSGFGNAYALEHLRDIGVERTKTRRLDDAVEIVARMRRTDPRWHDVNVDTALTKWIAKLVKEGRRPDDDRSLWPKPVRRAVGSLEADHVRRFVEQVINDVRLAYNGDNYDVQRLINYNGGGAGAGSLERGINEVERWAAMRERFKRRGLVVNVVKDGVSSRELLVGAGLVGLTALGIGAYHMHQEAQRRRT